MFAAGWVGMGAAWLPRGRGRLLALGIYGALWGWLYGALTNLSFWPFTVLAPDISWTPGLSLLDALRRYGRFYLVTSLAWDTMLAVGNLVLLLALAVPLLKPLERFQRRARVAWEPA
jgi:energy-coupling factor transport system substrate-specific component